ncbi:MAG: DDE-type integrase/transposase/recombinase [Oscillospiraceae bacterium]|nr:DDE-type integrase/transposase/recombinase [Oscillospiraceae bacterium]
MLRHEFSAEKTFEKCVTDITKIPANDGKLYISAVYNCFDTSVLGIAMTDNMRAELCVQTVENACKSYPEMRGAVIHSDRGSQYTSEKYHSILTHFGFIQSMDSAGAHCHDNAICESMWVRMKDELFYLRDRKPENYTIN